MTGPAETVESPDRPTATNPAQPQHRATLTPSPLAAARTSCKRILLSCFDGLGTAALIFAMLQVPLLAYVAWEIDTDCIMFTTKKYPQVHHRGDFTKDNKQHLLDFLDSIDPNHEAELWWVAGPPCPDFSRIRGSNSPGMKGNEGRKFVQFTEFREQVNQAQTRHQVRHRERSVQEARRSRVLLRSVAMLASGVRRSGLRGHPPATHVVDRGGLGLHRLPEG